MSLEQRGAYITLLCYAWREGGIPSDHGVLARLLGVTPKRFARIWDGLAGKFSQNSENSEKKLINPRMEFQRQELAKFIESRRKAGLASGRARARVQSRSNKRATKTEHTGEHNRTLQSSDCSLQTSVEETQGFFYVSVVHLCDLLADSIKDNGVKRPSVTEKWRQEAERMLRIDGRDPDEAAQLIRWAQAHEFWRSNVLSMPKFRQKYDQLLLQSKRGENTERRHPADIQVAKLDALAERFAAEEAVA